MAWMIVAAPCALGRSPARPSTVVFWAPLARMVTGTAPSGTRVDEDRDASGHNRATPGRRRGVVPRTRTPPVFCISFLFGLPRRIGPTRFLRFQPQMTSCTAGAGAERWRSPTVLALPCWWGTANGAQLGLQAPNSGRLGTGRLRQRYAAAREDSWAADGGRPPVWRKMGRMKTSCGDVPGTRSDIVAGRGRRRADGRRNQRRAPASPSRGQDEGRSGRDPHPGRGCGRVGSASLVGRAVHWPERRPVRSLRRAAFRRQLRPQ